MFSKLNVVSVDDNTVNLLLIEAMSKEIGLKVRSFSNPLKAIDYIEDNTIDLVFVDYMMPEMHGVDFIKRVRILHPDIPIIMITAVNDDNELKIEAIEAGATEFLNKPVNPPEFKARVINMAQLRKTQILLRDKAALLQDEVAKAVKIIRDREQEALRVLGLAAEYKDPETGAHIMRVAKYSEMIAIGIGEPVTEQELLLYAAPLHDIGKIGIPDNILTKAGSLTNEEFSIMKTHTYKGFAMLKDTRSPYLKAGGIVAMTHHEKFDGSGYPNGLKGKDIPLFGRVVAIADVFDALTSRRPYKEAWTLERAMDLLVSEKGKHFDPELADVFVENVEMVENIRKDCAD